MGLLGKQHDVSECMDNCMFQIETALLKFDGLSGSQAGKDSVVKRLDRACILEAINRELNRIQALLRQNSSTFGCGSL